MKSWPKSKLDQTGVGSNIAQNHLSSPQKGISGHISPNSYEKLIKNEIRLSWSLNIAQNHSSSQEIISSLISPIHIKRSPNSKLGKVRVGLNIAQNHSSSLLEVIPVHYLPHFTFEQKRNWVKSLFRDLPVDIYGPMVSPQGRVYFPPDKGRDFFSPGRGRDFFSPGRGRKFLFFTRQWENFFPKNPATQ